MTIKELKQLWYLPVEIASDEKRLAEMVEDATASPTPKLSNMPHGGEIRSPTERSGIRIAAFKSALERKKRELSRLEDYINDVPDSHVRQILTYRFFEGYSWCKVARKMGGNNTSDGVRMAAIRYLEKN